MATIHGTDYHDDGTLQTIDEFPYFNIFGELKGTSSADWIYGKAGNDALNGDAGNDRLNGGSGADIMTGGTGNDTYYVDTMSDIVIESASEGTDKVVSSVSTTYKWLPANVEKLTLTGAAYYGNGNDFSNIITGTNNANNLYGHGGSDTLIGLGGNDLLDGGLGADTMKGGTGSDGYWVDTLSDIVIELADEGLDKVFSSVSTSIKWLPTNIENLTLTGTAYYGDGNDLNNTILGTDSPNHLVGYGGNDWLNGGLGADIMKGGTGNDIYWVDTMSDIVTELAGEGNDTVLSPVSTSFKWLPANVEKLSLIGTAIFGDGNDLNNTILGSEHTNNLYGYGGNDFLNGRGGTDSLHGGIGSDGFVFTNNQATGGVDIISDFSAPADSIYLAARDGAAFNQGLSFSGASVGSPLRPDWYFEGAGFNGNGTELSGIFVDTSNGNIWYNPTSSTPGDSYHFATVTGAGSSLSPDDFLLF